jgi:HAD superfamily phosphoserine phosphatase-like hydrolase
MSAWAAAPRYASVVLDVDSTLAGIEGIDWLADRRGGETAAFVRGLTEETMSGRLALEDAYARRLDGVAPTRQEVRGLAQEYRATVAPGAGAAIAKLMRAGLRVVAISGGLSEAIAPLCRDVSLNAGDVFAVVVHWDDRGNYVGFDRASPLATQGGKGELLRGLALPRPILAVGDGSTDLVMRTSGAADEFAAFTGFVRRPSVVEAADHVVESFDGLIELVLPSAA